MLKCEAVEPDGKSCLKCGVYKPMAAYYRQAGCKFGLTPSCKACLGAANRKRHAANPGARAERTYGMAPSEWSAMWDQQSGTCAVCATDLEVSRYGRATDHCHTTGRVRGIVCHPCNKGLGFFRDNPAILRAAATYIEAHA